MVLRPLGRLLSLFGRSLLLALLVTFSSEPGSCAGAEEITLLAGAGLRRPVDVLAARFERQTGHRVLSGYDGSGRLLARIQASGRGDVFMPGALFYIERLQEQDLIRSVRPLVAHTPVIGVARGAARSVRTLEDLARPGLRLALGDPRSMAFGRMARDIVKRSGLEREILANVVVRGATVKQLALYVARGDVEASIIGRADAIQFEDRVLMVPIPPALYTPETIAVAVLETARDPILAERLAGFMASPEALAVFRDHGFLPLEE